ncbi:Alpha/Beta hydrolase protein [Halenospora varia]|nr:Alpha/Beta hydrolase protein [Halenospora varia]
MAAEFSTIPPGASVTPTPFTVDVAEEALDELNTLVKLSKISKPTYENTTSDAYFGVTREWIENAVSTWKNDFSWREKERYLNTFPQFTVPVELAGKGTLSIHFTALFSEKEDAIPVLFLHGWPGSFLEFLPILSLLCTKYTPSTLPYHVIVPSLPGFAFSDPPPLDSEFDLGDVAEMMDALMVGLGFGGGYVAQGGDVGSKVARILGSRFEGCQGVHLNYCYMPEPKSPIGTLDDQDRIAIARSAEFAKTGGAYGSEHATRPSTIGFVLSSNPIALLAWIGEKFLEWTDATPPLDTILEAVTLYWFTDTFCSSIYQYRQTLQPVNKGGHAQAEYYIHKPLGFTAFAKEIVPGPKAWVATTGNLMFYRKCDVGGHFAALEQPERLLGDVTDFIEQVWKV